MDKINFTQAYGPVVISPEKITNIFNASGSIQPLKIGVSFSMKAEYLYHPSSISSQTQLSGMVRLGMGAYEYLKDFEVRRLYFDVDGVKDIHQFELLLKDMVRYTGVDEYVVTMNEYSRHGGLSFHVFFRAKMHWLAMRNYVRKYKLDAIERKVPCAECIDHLPYMEKQTFRCVYSPNAINRHIDYQAHEPDHLVKDQYLVELVNAYSKAKTTNLPNGFQEPRDFHFPIMSTYPPGYKKANVFFIQDTNDCQRIIYTDPYNYVVPLDKEFKKMNFLIDDPEYDEIWERAKNQQMHMSLAGHRKAGAKPERVPRQNMGKSTQGCRNSRPNPGQSNYSKSPSQKPDKRPNTQRAKIPSHEVQKGSATKQQETQKRTTRPGENRISEKPIDRSSQTKNYSAKKAEDKALNDLKTEYGATVKGSNQRKRSSRYPFCKVSDL